MRGRRRGRARTESLRSGPPPVRPLRPVPGRLEHVADEVVQLASGDPWPHRLSCPLERLEHERLHRTHLLADLTDDERPGHVRPAARLLVARPEIDDDREAGRQRARARVVTEPTPGRGDDDVRRRRRAAGLASVAHGGPNRRRGQDPPSTMSRPPSVPARRSSSAAALIPASAAACARRMPASSGADFARRLAAIAW